MSEKQEEYTTKKTGSVNIKELQKYLTELKDQKLFQNRHREDPLELGVVVLSSEMKRELKEYFEALWIYFDDSSEENAMALLYEIADVSIYLDFIAAKVAGFTSLIRK